jgi:hypothetical protein
MALPSKGDPQRPLALAVRSTRILGILFIGLGLCGTLPMLFLGIRRAGGTGGAGGAPVGMIAFATLSTIVIYFGPGALYIVCSIFLARRRTWAVITAMVLAGIQLLFIAFGLVSLAIVYFSAAAPARMGFIWIPIGVTVLIMLALAQLEYHLSRCFEAIRLAPVDVQRGFEPLPPMPSRPVMAESDAATDADGR